MLQWMQVCNVKNTASYRHRFCWFWQWKTTTIIFNHLPYTKSFFCMSHTNDHPSEANIFKNQEIGKLHRELTLIHEMAILCAQIFTAPAHKTVYILGRRHHKLMQRITTMSGTLLARIAVTAAGVEYQDPSIACHLVRCPSIISVQRHPVQHCM